MNDDFTQKRDALFAHVKNVAEQSKKEAQSAEKNTNVTASLKFWQKIGVGVSLVVIALVAIILIFAFFVGFKKEGISQQGVFNTNISGDGAAVKIYNQR